MNLVCSSATSFVHWRQSTTNSISRRIPWPNATIAIHHVFPVQQRNLAQSRLQGIPLYVCRRLCDRRLLGDTRAGSPCSGVAAKDQQTLLGVIEGVHCYLHGSHPFSDTFICTFNVHETW